MRYIIFPKILDQECPGFLATLAHVGSAEEWSALHPPDQVTQLPGPPGIPGCVVPLGQACYPQNHYHSDTLGLRLTDYRVNMHTCWLTF